MNESAAETGQAHKPSPEKAPRVGLFVTCLVDIIRPIVGFAAVKLLEDAGCRVVVPSADLLRPAGLQFRRPRARPRRSPPQTIEAFDGLRLCRRAERLLRRDARDPLSRTLRGRTGNGGQGGGLSRPRPTSSSASSSMCSGSRASPRAMTASSPITIPARAFASSASRRSRESCSESVEGLKLVELEEPETCCGFGGLFAVKYGEISDSIVERKCADIGAVHADTVLAGDLGCLMNMAGKLQREGSTVKVRHIAEVLAGMADGPAIGESRKEESRDERGRDHPRIQGERARSPARRAAAARARPRRAISWGGGRRPRRACRNSRRCATAPGRSRTIRSRISTSISRLMSARSRRPAARCISRRTRRKRGGSSSTYASPWAQRASPRANR